MTSSQLQLATIVSDQFGENCYIAWLSGRKDCLVVDPGFDDDKILQLLDSKGLQPAAILNTHGHSDHIAGNAAMKSRWPECPLVIGAKESSKLIDPWQNLSAHFGGNVTSPPADLLLSQGDKYEAAGFRLDVAETPGHSSGHVVFIWKERSPVLVFGGDVLFAGSVGRTDFPDGDFEQLAASIRRQLYSLPDDTVVLPGHGPPTTIGHEKRHNSFVRGEA